MDYILRRLAGMIPVLFFTWTVVFVVIQVIPGDPVNLMLAGVPASEEVRANERARLGLDRPVVERYVTFLGKALKGDLGESFRTRQPVGQDDHRSRPGLLSNWPLGGLLVGLLMGLALGILAGHKTEQLDRHDLHDARARRCFAAFSFWIGMMLIYVFGIMLGVGSDSRTGAASADPSIDHRRSVSWRAGSRGWCDPRSSTRWDRTISALHGPRACRAPRSCSSTRYGMR